MKKVSIIVINDCIAASVVGLYDILSRVSSMSSELDQELDESVGFHVELISLEKQKVVYSDSGFPIHCHKSFDEQDSPNIVIVPALRHLPEFSFIATLLDWLKAKNGEGVTICSVCTGAFVLAETGLLHGKESTVSWFAAEEFKLRYPNVKIKKESVLIDNSNIIMTGASTSFLNLGIYLIEKFYGKKLANYAAKILLINKGNISQQSYSIFIGQKKHGDENIQKAQKFIEDNIHENITVKTVIDETPLTERTFIRKFKEATGITPLEYIQRTKVEYAKKELESGEINISQISYATGYEDLNFFRQIFKRYTGLTPSQYQNQFSF